MYCIGVVSGQERMQIGRGTVNDMPNREDIVIKSMTRKVHAIEHRHTCTDTPQTLQIRAGH